MMYSRGTRANKIAIAISAVVGILLMILIRDHRIALLIFIGITWVESTFFVVRYGFWSAWRTFAGGRALFFHVLSFWVLITWIMLSVVFGTNWTPFREDVRELLYMAFAISFFNMILTLLRIQRHYPGDVQFRNPFGKQSFESD